MKLQLFFAIFLFCVAQSSSQSLLSYLFNPFNWFVSKSNSSEIELKPETEEEKLQKNVNPPAPPPMLLKPLPVIGGSNFEMKMNELSHPVPLQMLPKPVTVPKPTLPLPVRPLLIKRIGEIARNISMDQEIPEADESENLAREEISEEEEEESTTILSSDKDQLDVTATTIQIPTSEFSTSDSLHEEEVKNEEEKQIPEEQKEVEKEEKVGEKVDAVEEEAKEKEEEECDENKEVEEDKKEVEEEKKTEEQTTSVVLEETTTTTCSPVPETSTQELSTSSLEPVYVSSEEPEAENSEGEPEEETASRNREGHSGEYLYQSDFAAYLNRHYYSKPTVFENIHKMSEVPIIEGMKF